MTKWFQYSLIGLTLSLPVLISVLLEHYEFIPSTPSTTFSIVSTGVVTALILFMSTVMSFRPRGETV